MGNKMELFLSFYCFNQMTSIMKTKENQLKGKDLIEAYITQINWDWLFFKGQTIFAALLLLGLAIFFLWFTR